MRARVLAIPKATLGNWVRLCDKGDLQGAGDRPVSAEQMELARPRAELARVKTEREMLRKKQRRTSQGICCEVACVAANKAVWPISLICEALA